MLVKILVLLAAVVVVVLIIAALQPSTFRITRRATMAAPPARIFAQVNDLRKWQAWSPYEKIDPALKRTYSGAAAGVGAVYAWAGNNAVGTGRMTITDIRPDASIWIKLEFFKPLAGVCTAEFSFKPEDGRTVVTWSMSGNNNYLAKIFCLFISSEKMIGGPFEKGLSSLKALVETAPGP